MSVRKKPIHEKSAPKQKPRNPHFLKRVFVFIGKPIFALLFFTLYSIYLLPIATGHFYGTAIKPLKKRVLKKSVRFFSKIRTKKGRYTKKKAVYLHIHRPQPRRVTLLLVICTGVFVMSAITGALFYHYIVKDLPNPQALTSRALPVSTKIYDRNGVLLYTIYKDHNRTPISLSEIPTEMKLATLAVEDSEFYTHPGFSIRGIVRSVKRNLERGELTGGSTITQQLVKNALLSSEKTFTRKTKELLLAVLVEQMYTKDQILEMYLNEVSFGGTAYGVEEASKTYFGKNIQDITLAEAALLAGLPRSPTKYSPFGNNPELSISRQKEVLRLMEENGFITSEQRKEAEEQNLVYKEHKTDIKAPHFVAYIRSLLEERYGKEMVEQGGLSVTTSLDYEIQQFAEETLAKEVEKLGKLHVKNGAVLVLQPETGEILAMVGSKDYFDYENDGNVNVTLRERQPGSSIKVVNYAYALAHGMTPASIIEDSPVTFLISGQDPYSPKNYEGSFRGKITLRSALAESRNIPAVRVLYTNGIQNMIDLGKNMGITSWTDSSRYGLSLTLGGGEVRLLDLARVYATLANYGNRPPVTPILHVTNYKHEILDKELCVEKIEGEKNERQIANIPNLQTLAPNDEKSYQIFDSQVLAATSSEEAIAYTNQYQCVSTPVLDPRVAFTVTDILKDNQARTPAFGSNSLLVIPNHPEVAVKTGTSNDLRDNLAVGYTKDYVVAVWVGNNDNSQMSRIASGVTGATPIWHTVMAGLLSPIDSYEWNVPPHMIKTSVCPYTGTLACQGCPNKEEWFLEENSPTLSCRNFVKLEEKKEEGKPEEKPKPKREIIDLREVNQRIKNPNRRFTQ